MGDKSPKSTRKRAGQKKVKTDEIKRKKKAADNRGPVGPTCGVQAAE